MGHGDDNLTITVWSSFGDPVLVPIAGRHGEVGEGGRHGAQGRTQIYSFSRARFIGY